MDMGRGFTAARVIAENDARYFESLRENETIREIHQAQLYRDAQISQEQLGEQRLTFSIDDDVSDWVTTLATTKNLIEELRVSLTGGMKYNTDEEEALELLDKIERRL